jgi:hypothetical protein
MSFLAPLFLIGGLAVALPVLFHLIRQTTRDRTVFSSLMFLRSTPPRLTRRSRLEHLALLALRCLVLCLLAAGFARPFLKQPMPDDVSAGSARRIILLVDAGASMRRGNLWGEAREKAAKTFRTTTPADQVAVLTFDHQLHTLVAFDQWKTTAIRDRVTLAERVLAATTPGWLSSHLDDALVQAAEMLADSNGQASGQRQIILISDLKEGGRLGGLQSYEWPKGIEVLLDPVGPLKTSNAGLELAATVEESETVAAAAVRVRVVNAADSHHDRFSVAWSDSDGQSLSGTAQEIWVPAGQSRIVSVAAPPKLSGARLVLRGDEEEFDNTVFVIPPEAARSSVLYVGREPEKDARQPFYFLQRALQNTRQRTVHLVLRAPEAPSIAVEAREADVIVVADPPGNEALAEIRAQVETGKTLVCVCRTPAMSATLARLFGREALSMEEALVSSYVMLSEVDLRHPLFTPFADPRFNDFTGIHFWKYRRLDPAALPGARVLAKFDTEDPALIEVPVGKGRALVFTSSWQPADSQLALSSKFVPLLHSVLELGSRGARSEVSYQAGEAIPLPSELVLAGGMVTVQRPDGSTVSMEAGATNFTQSSLPGIYRVNVGENSRQFAVNLDPAESRTAPLAVEQLERMGVPVIAHVTEPARETRIAKQLQNVEQEERQRLWRWFLVATLAVLLFETWLAGRAARHLALAKEALS